MALDEIKCFQTSDVTNEHVLVLDNPSREIPTHVTVFSHPNVHVFHVVNVHGDEPGQVNILQMKERDMAGGYVQCPNHVSCEHVSGTRAENRVIDAGNTKVTQKMKADQERVTKLLNDTVTLLCKNGLIYQNEIKVQGLLGITLDKNEVFIVHINETIGSTGKESSSDGGRGKNPASGVPVVDLTRIVDTLATMQIPSGNRGMMMPGMGQNSRKQRPPMMSPAAMSQMMQRGDFMQQMQRFRMGMMPGGMPPGVMPPMPNQMGQYPPRQLNRHMAQMRHRMQHTNSTPQHRRNQAQMQSMTVSLDDDEDVVIIGTGHEEPSPHWSTPLRRTQQQNRSGANQSSQSSARSSQSVPSPSVAKQGASKTVSNSNASPSSSVVVLHDGQSVRVELNEVTDVDSAPEGTTNNIPSQPTVVEPDNLLDEIVIEPRLDDTSNDKTTNDSGRLSEPQFISLDSLGKMSADANADEETEMETGAEIRNTDADINATDASRGEKENETAKETAAEEETDRDADASTDVAEDVKMLTDSAVTLKLIGQEDVLNFEALGFDILTKDSPLFAQWLCKSDGCSASYVDAAHLANHYTVFHTQDMNLTVPRKQKHLLTSAEAFLPSTPGDGNQKKSSDGSNASSKKRIPCPSESCSRWFNSLIGLNMHHKKVHGEQLSKQQRREIVAKYGKPYSCQAGCSKGFWTKRELIYHHVSIHDMKPPTSDDGASPTDGDATMTDDGAAVSKNFVCLVGGCDVSCSSREAVMEHLVACHSTEDQSKVGVENSVGVNSPAVKEENDDSENPSV